MKPGTEGQLEKSVTTACLQIYAKKKKKRNKKLCCLIVVLFDWVG